MNKGHCFQCETVNPPEQSYCGHCGAALVLKDFIDSQVSKKLETVIRDRDILELESATRVFKQAWDWATLVGRVMLVPIGLAVILLGWLGWKEFNLSKAAANAQQQIETSATSKKQEINRQADTSIGEIRDTSGKAIESNHQSVEAATKATKDVTSTAARTKAELRTEAASVRDDVAKSKVELQEVHRLQPEFNIMRSQLQQATDQLTAQQKVISSSEDFVKHVFSSHITYGLQFPELVQKNAAVIVPAPSGVKDSIVYMLVPTSPVQGTIQLQWGVFTQPPGSFFSHHNLVIFFWGQAPTDLKNNALFISLFADTSDKKYRTLDFHDGKAWVDGQSLPTVRTDPEFSHLPEPSE